MLDLFGDDFVPPAGPAGKTAPAQHGRRNSSPVRTAVDHLSLTTGALALFLQGHLGAVGRGARHPPVKGHVPALADPRHAGRPGGIAQHLSHRELHFGCHCGRGLAPRSGPPRGATAAGQEGLPGRSSLAAQAAIGVGSTGRAGLCFLRSRPPWVAACDDWTLARACTLRTAGGAASSSAATSPSTAGRGAPPPPPGAPPSPPLLLWPDVRAAGRAQAPCWAADDSLTGRPARTRRARLLLSPRSGLWFAAAAAAPFAAGSGAPSAWLPDPFDELSFPIKALTQ